jgi:hypothetical protein
MKPSTGKAVPYTFLAILAAIGLSLVVSWLLIAIRFV